jgi:phosphoribosylglycinamide formyltransferase 1
VIGVLVSGEGTNLQALIEAGLPIAGVISSKPGVRALDRAEAAGIETAVFDLNDFKTREDRDEAMADWLEARGVDLVVCAGFMWLLRPSFLERFPNHVVNTHAAFLPEFPGASPIADALEAGATQTGATVHLVDNGVDSGPILAQERVPIEPGDTAETLWPRVKAVEQRLLPKVVAELLSAPSRSSGAAGGAGPEGTV